MDDVKETGICIWLFGKPASGKTTLADRLWGRLNILGYEKVERLDGDIVRGALTRDLGFSLEDRFENVRRVAWVAKKLVENGIVVIASFITPLKAMRFFLKRYIPHCILIEIDASIEECMSRDPKKLYQSALEGEIKEFTGLTQAYEEGGAYLINTENEKIEDCVEHILDIIGYEVSGIDSD